MKLEFSWTDNDGGKMNKTLPTVTAVIIDDQMITYSFINKDGKEDKDFRMLKELDSFELRS